MVAESELISEITTLMGRFVNVPNPDVVAEIDRMFRLTRLIKHNAESLQQQEEDWIISLKLRLEDTEYMIAESGNNDCRSSSVSSR